MGLRDLFAWLFLMAFAHGAGVALAIGLHTLAMLVVMAAMAWVVYKKLGLRVLRQSWGNFDLIWAVGPSSLSEG